VSDRVTVQDVLPTLAQVASIELLPSQPVDGAGRWETVKGESKAAETDFVAVSMDDRAVLKGDWKLVSGGDAPELYNLAEDPYEQDDLAGENPRIVEQLQSVIENIPQRESINQPLFKVMMDMDRFGGEEDREPWADVSRQEP